MSVLNRALRLLQVAAIALTACVGLSCRAEVARPEQGYAGTWVMTLGQRVFIVLTIEPHGQAFAARIQAPASFDLPAAGSPLRYSHIQLPIKDRRSTRANVEGDHLRIVIEDPANPGEPDEFDLTLSDPDHASLQFVGVPVASMPFTRHAGAPPTPATDWDSDQDLRRPGGVNDGERGDGEYLRGRSEGPTERSCCSRRLGRDRKGRQGAT